MNPVRLIAACAAASVVAGIAGAWGWQALAQHRAVSAAAEAKAAAEAERLSPLSRQREAVKALLSDPESAQFRNVRESKRGKGHWCGEVNARNRMGGMVGFRRYIVWVPNLIDGASTNLDPYVTLEPDDTRPDESVSVRKMFLADWAQDCT